MKRANIIIIICCLITFCSYCKKNKCEFVGPTDTSFLIGIASEEFTLVNFESTIKIIGHPYSDKYYSVDVNGDGKMDFKFISNHGISPGGVNQQESSLRILNPEIEISVLEQRDTLHTCIDEYYVPESNITMSVVETYTKQSAFSCPETGTDSFRMIYEDIYPRVYNEGDTLNLSETWTNQGLTFIYFDNSSHSYPSSEENIYIKESYSIVRGLWNNSSSKYLLFRLEKPEIISYGWIKLRIYDYKEIWLYEYAIQKNAFCY